MLTALEDQKREVLELSQKSIGFSALQRDAASTQQMFETVRQRVKETELSGELQSNNAKILDRRRGAARCRFGRASSSI